MNKEEIEQKYQELCVTESDINQHLAILREYADKCESVVEMGVRGCVSLFAFLSSNAIKVTAVDILNVWTPEVEKLTFICADDLEIEIERTDLLFIDTLHNANHLRKELSLHANKVNKYIILHDVGIFGQNGDDGGEGLMFAVWEFLDKSKNWDIAYFTTVNNGLIIIRKA